MTELLVQRARALLVLQAPLVLRVQRGIQVTWGRLEFRASRGRRVIVVLLVQRVILVAEAQEAQLVSMAREALVDLMAL